MDNKFNLLNKKDILAILDGDKKFVTHEGIEIAMPYLSGPTLCKISKKFGCLQEYSQRNSRWEYLRNIIIYCSENGTAQGFLQYLFNIKNFEGQLKRVANVSQFRECYENICCTVLDEINKILYFDSKEMVKIGTQFYIRNIGQERQEINIEIPMIKAMDKNYISDLLKKAAKDIDNQNFDSAITKSRTLLEEVFCYAIEAKGEAPINNGNIAELYKQVKNQYNMHDNKDVDKRINNLLSGLNKIIISITEMRNKNSDSHGVGKKRKNIKEYHARLFLNSAIILVEFFLSIIKQN